MVSVPIDELDRMQVEPSAHALVMKNLRADVSSTDEWPLRELFRAHAGFVAAFVRRSGLCEHEVDDCVQEVFLLAHRLGGYRPGPAKPRTWLASIALNVVRSTIRKHARRRTVADEEKLASALADETDPFSRAAAIEALSVMQSILDVLDEDQRTAFLLHEVHGEECSSIAAAFGVPEGTVRSRVHRAKQMLIAEYEKRSRGSP